MHWHLTTTFISILLISTSTTQLMAQTKEIPYAKIENYPEKYTSATVISRMLDGFGYRFHWASKALRNEDLIYTPGNDGKSTLATLQHIYELAADAVLVSEGKEFIRPRAQVTNSNYEELRSQTLHNIYTASANFRAMSEKELSNLKVIFSSAKGKKEYEFWHFINGQLSDAIYHTGQLVSFRRSSGNPVSKEMNVFTAGM